MEESQRLDVVFLDLLFADSVTGGKSFDLSFIFFKNSFSVVVPALTFRPTVLNRFVRVFGKSIG